MSSLELFLPLIKVDLDQRLVAGVATAEAPDRSGEIFDYASSKPYFETWSAEAAAASGGKSLGAVRAMHGRIAAGKLTDIAFDDEAKRIVVSAKIVDDDEWEKVLEGVYTGFSQGGRYVKRWADPETGLVRYTAEPHEISLVDLPCLPGATFEVVKNGVVEKRAFAVRGEAPAELTAAAQAAPEPPAPAAETKTEERARPPSAPPSAAPGAPEALAKAAAALAEAALKLERLADENARLRRALDDASPVLADLTQRIQRLEAQPLPAKAALRAIAKSADAGAEPSGPTRRSVALRRCPPRRGRWR